LKFEVSIVTNSNRLLAFGLPTFLQVQLLSKNNILLVSQLTFAKMAFDYCKQNHRIYSTLHQSSTFQLLHCTDQTI